MWPFSQSKIFGLLLIVLSLLLVRAKCLQTHAVDNSSKSTPRFVRLRSSEYDQLKKGKIYITNSRQLQTFEGNGNFDNDLEAVDPDTPFSDAFISPGKFCIGGDAGNTQCTGNRKEPRPCVDLNNGLFECKETTARSLGLLFGFLLIIWIVMFTCCCSRIEWSYAYSALSEELVTRVGSVARISAIKVPEISKQEVLLNTLADLCIKTESLLLDATVLYRNARALNNVITVEQRAEMEFLLVTVQHFQACTAIIAILTHRYMATVLKNSRTQVGDRDVDVRGLQLHIMLYIHSRLSSAMNTDAFSNKSLARIAECSVILRSLTENIQFYGWSADVDETGEIGHNRSRFGEEACVIHGRDRMGISIGDQNDYRQLDPREFLDPHLKRAYRFDPIYHSISDKKRSKAISFSFSPNFPQLVSILWGAEIKAAKRLVQTWVRDFNEFKKFLRVQKDLRLRNLDMKVKRRKEKRKQKDIENITAFYTENQSEFSGYNPYDGKIMLNIQSVIAQGLSVVGDARLPFSVSEYYVENDAEQLDGSKDFYPDDLKNDRQMVKDLMPGKLYQRLVHFVFSKSPNLYEWPKFHVFVFILIPTIIFITFATKINKGASAIDIDGNLFGGSLSFEPVPDYYFLDGEVPPKNINEDLNERLLNAEEVQALKDAFADRPNLNDVVNEVQASLLRLKELDNFFKLQNIQGMEKFFTPFIYAFMHIGLYFFSLAGLALCRELGEILARWMPSLHYFFPLDIWRDLHILMGLLGNIFVLLGAFLFAGVFLLAGGNHVPFAGLSTDPNVEDVKSLQQNKYLVRVIALPLFVFLPLMYYADKKIEFSYRPRIPVIFVKNKFEIYYFFHITLGLSLIFLLVITQIKTFYYLLVTWGMYLFNKVIRFTRTKKASIKDAQLVNYRTVDKTVQEVKTTNLLRLKLNVPPGFPKASRGQTVYLTVPSIDLVSHPFLLAKAPTENDHTITLNIEVIYHYMENIKKIHGQGPRGDTIPSPIDTHDLPTGWKTAIDPGSGLQYFYNSKQQRTTWTRPIKSPNFFNRISNRITGNYFSRNDGTSTIRREWRGFSIMHSMNRHRDYVQPKVKSWTQKLVDQVGLKKDVNVYVSAPLGSSMENVLRSTLPGTAIICTKSGLPAAESAFHWLLGQTVSNRPKFVHFLCMLTFLDDVLPVVQALRDSVCEAIQHGRLNKSVLAHPVISRAYDWFGVSIYLSSRNPFSIGSDRETIIHELKPLPNHVKVSPKVKTYVEQWLMHRIMPGKAKADRLIMRFKEVVHARSGLDRLSILYCGSKARATSTRLAARMMKETTETSYTYLN